MHNHPLRMIINHSHKNALRLFGLPFQNVSHKDILYAHTNQIAVILVEHAICSLFLFKLISVEYLYFIILNMYMHIKMEIFTRTIRFLWYRMSIIKYCIYLVFTCASSKWTKYFVCFLICLLFFLIPVERHLL